MIKSNAPQLPSIDDNALDAVSGGTSETFMNAVSRYGERRTNEAFEAVFGDYSGLDMMSDYGFVPTMMAFVPITAAAIVTRTVGGAEGAVRWATGTTDYVEPR